MCTTLQNQNIPCFFTNSDLSQQERQNIMEQFKTGQIKYLITTDLLARGIDI